jgi:hypothetical protein
VKSDKPYSIKVRHLLEKLVNKEVRVMYTVSKPKPGKKLLSEYGFIKFIEETFKKSDNNYNYVEMKRAITSVWGHSCSDLAKKKNQNENDRDV